MRHSPQKAGSTKVTNILGAKGSTVKCNTKLDKLGPKALEFDGWNISVGLLRNILIPGLLFMVALAHKDGPSPELAAEGVLFTHLLGVGSLLGYVYLIDRFLV
ncbi:hypothetical protein MASR2M78_37200 [Treponema sp.]